MDSQASSITVETVVEAPIEKVWQCWTGAEHIKHWCSASDDWYVPFASNDLRLDAKFTTTMAARDGSASFDFEGVYTNIRDLQRIEYTIADGRKVQVEFTQLEKGVKISETFEPEHENPIEMQRGGWQAILDNFKKYTEQH